MAEMMHTAPASVLGRLERRDVRGRPHGPTGDKGDVEDSRRSNTRRPRIASPVLVGSYQIHRTIAKLLKFNKP